MLGLGEEPTKKAEKRGADYCGAMSLGHCAAVDASEARVAKLPHWGPELVAL